MVSGHLRIKNGIYHAIIDYFDDNGNRKQKSQSLKIVAKGNKKKAEEMLYDLRKNFVPPKSKVRLEDEIKEDMLFCDFLKIWLIQVKSTVAPTTYDNYEIIVNNKIIPYFEPKHLKIGEVQAKHLESYYLYQLKRVKAITVKHDHTLLHKVFDKAFKLDLVIYNPVDKVDPPRVERFDAKPFTEDELKILIEGTQDNKIGFLILVTAMYGLRRSEALGIRWQAIDFKNNLITINHTVTVIKVNGKKQPVGADRTKNKSSCRQLPLTEEIKVRLKALRQIQDKNREMCGNAYNTEWEDYVFVDEIGNIINPDYVEYAFPKILKELGLGQHRFHDLRHTCATIMNHNKIPLKDVQEFLGHSNIQTTADIYTHLDWGSKEKSIKSMQKSVAVPQFKGIKDPWI